jgi:VanZ family protein
MRPLFIFLSMAYVAGIFLLADSSVVSYLGKFNPYSLLHIPLYAILTILIVFSLLPMYPRINTSTLARCLISGMIALIVAVADEFHQSSISIRDASVIDVFLDLAGIVLALLVIVHFCKRLKRSKRPNFEL